MLRILILLTLLSTQLLFGFDLRIEYSPDNPRAGESFQVYFIATSENGEDLEDIQFKPIGADVLSKDTKSTSTRTTYINGKLSSFTTQTISYDLFADQNATDVTLSKITLKGSNGDETFDDVKVDLLKVRSTKDFFVKAVIDNENLYVGQGATLTYYLYSRTSTSNVEIKKFPVLKNTLKRFKKQRFVTSRVTYNGQTYDRTQVYATVLFPEKSGSIEIDPITISARFAVGRKGRSDSFSVFGFNFGSASRRIRKVLKSKSVRLRVKPLPKPIPNNFKGLVGTHTFNINFNKTRFLANEPVEVKLAVEGTGELEAFEAPVIFDDLKFEKFDSDGKLSLGESIKSRKDFSYTYLAKVAGSYPARKISIATFDPNNSKYINHIINIPNITVAGSVAGSDKGRTSNINGLGLGGNSSDFDNTEGSSSLEYSNQGNSILPNTLELTQLTGVVGPYFQYNSFVTNWLDLIAIFLLVLITIVLILIFKDIQLRREKTPYDKMLRKLESKKWQYYDLYQFLDLLRLDNQDKSMLSIVRDSELSLEAKNFYQKVIEVVAQKEYSQEQIKGLPRLKAKYLKEVVKIATTADKKLNGKSNKVDEFEFL